MIVTMSSVYMVNEGPDPETERIVPYYSTMQEWVWRRQRVYVSRQSRWKYLAHGFPVFKGGPKVRVPVFYRLKRVYTTVEAMERFTAVVDYLEQEFGVVTG